MIVAGFGCRAAADTASLEAALTLAQEGHPPVTALATVDTKAPLLAPLAEALHVPLIALPRSALLSVVTPTQSRASHAAHGTGSVAEASALAAAGSGARLLNGRAISPDRMATCAIAQGIER